MKLTRRSVLRSGYEIRSSQLTSVYGMAAFPTVWWWDAQRAAKTGSRS